ncbi:hypothetical protein BH23THE1_BH23THE1_36340 [soil metagenome]
MSVTPNDPTPLRDICTEFKSISSETDDQIQKLVAQRNERISKLLNRLLSQDKTADEEISRLHKQLPSNEEIIRLTLQCRAYEEKISQLESQLSSSPKSDQVAQVIAICKKHEQTISDLTAHHKFTTWLQQSQPQLMGQLLPLYNQSQVQPQ